MRKRILVIFSSLLAMPLHAQPQIYRSISPLEISKSFITQNNLTKASLNHNNFTEVKAGGYGGNEQIGLLTYEGSNGASPALNIYRDDKAICYASNQNVAVYRDKKIITFPCAAKDSSRNNLYWNGYLGQINGGYSPVNDVLFGADAINQMFEDWYHIAPLTDATGHKKYLTVTLAPNFENAYLTLDKFSIVLGEGASHHYPYTSINILAYYYGYYITEANSNLSWSGSQSGGINIAFSNITAMAAEYYVTGKNTWQVGGEISKTGEAYQYLDKPSKNCHGKEPGDWCDIDTMSQYKSSLLAYFTSGIFSRAFYELATSKNWNTHKAYDVFMQANRYHWKQDTNFQQGACDLVTSARELNYDANAVMIAFSVVGIDTRDC